MGASVAPRHITLDQRARLEDGRDANLVGDEDRDDAGAKVTSCDGHLTSLGGDDAGGHGVHQRYDDGFASVAWGKCITGVGVVGPVVLVSAVVEKRRAVPHERSGAVPCDPRLRGEVADHDLFSVDRVFDLLYIVTCISGTPIAYGGQVERSASLFPMDST